MRALLIVMAIAEATVGLCLLAFPSLTVLLLLGATLETAVAMAVARVAGMALLTLGVACWLTRADSRSIAARGLVTAMSIYNAGVCGVLVYGALGAGLSSFALWPVAVGHAVFAVWCVMERNRSG